jgi:hypothetical protein
VSTPTLVPTDLLTIEDLAARLKLSVVTVRRLAKTTGLPVFRVTAKSGRLYAFWPDVERWIVKQRKAVN